MRPSYLYNGNSCIGKTTYLYWDGPLLLEVITISTETESEKYLIW